MSGNRRPDEALDAVPVPANHVVTAVFEGESVLYDTRKCRPFLLNVSAAAVWSLLDGRRSLADIVDVVAARFGVVPSLVELDVVATVARFEQLELLAPNDHAG